MEKAQRFEVDRDIIRGLAALRCFNEQRACHNPAAPAAIVGHMVSTEAARKRALNPRPSRQTIATCRWRSVARGFSMSAANTTRNRSRSATIV